MSFKESLRNMKKKAELRFQGGYDHRIRTSLMDIGRLYPCAYEFMDVPSSYEFKECIKALSHEDIARVLIDEVRRVEAYGGGEQAGVELVIIKLARAAKNGIEEKGADNE